MFHDRTAAGQMLARVLQPFRGEDPLILAVPRGGVLVAFPVWEVTGGELDLYITRKIGAPDQPELAVGAVAGDGFVLLNNDLVVRLGISSQYIEQAAQNERKEIQRRMRVYRGNRPLPDPAGRTVILVDDGVATGFTLLAALRGLKMEHPARLVLAVPVGPPDTLAMLRQEADEVYCLESPAYFVAVGQFYRHFAQVDDEEVLETLHLAWEK